MFGRIVSRITSKPERKAKKSFTLSIESVAYLEEVRKKNGAGSMSAILEEILRAAQREEKRAAIDRAMTEYDDSLTDEEVEEERQWGEFAMRGFPTEDPPPHAQRPAYL
jgi:predicted CopG family antitoxin